MTPDQFAKCRPQAGISVDSLKARIHADFVWTQIIRGKFQREPAGRRQGSRREAAGRQREAGRRPAYEYSLRPILFLVPRGAARAAYRGAQARCREPARALPELR